MRTSVTDAALMTLLGLLALAGVLVSGTGIEPLAVDLLAIFLSAVATLVSSLLFGHRRRKRLTVLPGARHICSGAIVIISVATTHWPLRLAYALSRESFDSVARRVRSGERFATPLRTGLFTIKQVELSEHRAAMGGVHPPEGASG